GQEDPDPEDNRGETRKGEVPAQGPRAAEEGEGAAPPVRPVGDLRQRDEAGRGVRVQGPGRCRRQARPDGGAEARGVLPSAGEGPLPPAGGGRPRRGGLSRRSSRPVQVFEEAYPRWL